MAKKKMWLISGILIILIVLFAYGQNYQYKNSLQKYSKAGVEAGSEDWKPIIRQQISDFKNRLNSQSTHAYNKNNIKIQIEQYQYYLDNNINPLTPSAAKYSVKFMEQAIYMFIPLLVIILAGDSVSGEFSSKTIKILLTRAVPRWKVLLSKYLALLILFSVLILETLLLSVLISGVMFNSWGFSEPVATGFKSIGDKLDATNAIKLLQWQYMILVYSLGWFVACTVGTISFMVSVLVRNTATSIGVMMASLITGSFLQFFLADWPVVKYFFVTNLNLPQYLSGSYQPISGMSLVFSTLVLLAWAVGALAVSFSVFTKQDVLV